MRGNQRHEGWKQKILCTPPSRYLLTAEQLAIVSEMTRGFHGILDFDSVIITVRSYLAFKT
jgi:hypothetical protein